MHLSPLQCVFLTVLSTLGNCACGCQPCDPPSAHDAVLVRVRDVQGNAIPIDAVTSMQGAEAGTCRRQLFSSSAAWVCSQDTPGLLHVTVQAAGQTFTREVTPVWETKEYDDCRGPKTVELSLEIPGAGCPPQASGAAIEGRLVDVLGRPAAGSATLRYQGTATPCTVESGTFRCPAQTSYTTTYDLSLALGSTHVERTLTVPATDCQVQAVDATLDLTKRSCTKGSWAITGSTATRRGARVSATATLAGGVAVPCTLQPSSSNGTREWTNFLCAAASITGGGSYRLEVSDGTRSVYSQLEIEDDGCEAKAASPRIDFLDLGNSWPPVMQTSAE